MNKIQQKTIIDHMHETNHIHERSHDEKITLQGKHYHKWMKLMIEMKHTMWMDLHS
jgi:hypothetical protein